MVYFILYYFYYVSLYVCKLLSVYYLYFHVYNFKVKGSYSSKFTIKCCSQFQLNKNTPSYGWKLFVYNSCIRDIIIIIILHL